MMGKGMKIKLPHATHEEGDSFERDALKRGESAEILTHLISNISEPFVLAIDSSYGTGKTTFVLRWKKLLQEEGFPCLYFNAWENDFSDDPFIAMVGEISSEIESLIPYRKKVSAKVKKALKSAKENAGNLIKSSLKASLSIYSGGFVNAGNSKSSKGKQVKDIFDVYGANKLVIDDFKKSLAALVKQVGAEANPDEVKPLVFFIDELDRCRPDFSLELLEKAKHLFNVEGILFVLAVDKEQLGHSIKTMYGVGMDVDGYLRRFIDLEYRLPDPDITIFAGVMFDKFGLEDVFAKIDGGIEYKKQMLDVFVELSRIFDFKLRVQEQCFAQLSVILKTIPDGWGRYIFLICALVLIKSVNSPLYYDYVKGGKSSGDLISCITSLHGGVEFVKTDQGKKLSKFISYAKYDFNEFDRKFGLSSMRDRMWGGEQVLLDISDKIITAPILRDIANKIEILDRFNTK